LPDTILIVDDEPDFLSLTSKVLESGGYHTVNASDGEEGLQIAEAELPDLVLLDLMMPGKSGLEVCKILKSQPKTSNVLVVIFTVLDREVDRRLSNDAGADGYFTKRFTPEDLLAKVKKFLDKGKVEKFSKQAGICHQKLRGRKILFEFDPSARYDRLVRDFALEGIANGEKTVVMSKVGSAVQHAIEADPGVELNNLDTINTISDIIDKHPEGTLNLVYDSLTDLALSIDSTMAYRFASNSLQRLSDPRATVLFLLNPSAHEIREVGSIRGLFTNQLTYEKKGITYIRMP